MAVSHQGVMVQTPKITPASFANSDAANAKKTVYTAGGDGAKVTGLIVTTTNTSPLTAQLWLTRSATSYMLGSTAVAASAGTNGSIATANLLAALMMPLPVDNDGQPYLFLESGDTLQVSFTNQIESTKNAWVTAIGANF